MNEVCSTAEAGPARDQYSSQLCMATLCCRGRGAPYVIITFQISLLSSVQGLHLSVFVFLTLLSHFKYIGILISWSSTFLTCNILVDRLVGLVVSMSDY